MAIQEAAPAGTAGVEAVEDGNERFKIEQHGFDYIPETERKMTIKETNLFWVGTNANLFFVSVGAIGITLGLNIWEAIIACVAGNALFALVAYGSIGAVRGGLPTLTFTRAVFGVKGNAPNALFSWVSSVAFEAINTIFGVFALLALFPLIGWHNSGTAGKLIAIGVQLLIGGGIAILGQATMVYIQRFFAFLLTIVLVVVFAATVGNAHFAEAHAPHLSTPMAFAFVFLATAAVASGPISYLYNAPDWVRYLPSKTPSKSIFRNITASSGITALFLCVMGAVLATRGNIADPVGGVKGFLPEWLFIIYILAVVGGSVANNVPTFYSSGLALQSLGVPLKRYQATATDITVSTGIVIYVIFFASNFQTVLNDFVALLIVWLGPFAGVWIVDGLMRRWRYDPAACHATKREQHSRYWGWNGINMPAWIALLAGVGICLLTVHAPFYEGFLSWRLDGADLSWFSGTIVSGAVYAVIGRKSVAASSEGVVDPELLATGGAAAGTGVAAGGAALATEGAQ